MVTAGPRSVFRRYDDDTKLAEIGRSPPAGSLPRARRRRVFTICNCFILHNFLRGNFFSYEIFLTPLEAVQFELGTGARLQLPSSLSIGSPGHQLVIHSCILGLHIAARLRRTTRGPSSQEADFIKSPSSLLLFCCDC